MMAVDMRLVDPERRADVAADVVIADAARFERANRRPPAITPREALQAIDFEALLVAVAASNLANGVELSDGDRDRLWLAAKRISTLTKEATR